MRGSSGAPFMLGAFPGEDLIDGQFVVADLDDDLCEFIRRTATAKFDFPERTMRELAAVLLDQLLESLRRNAMLLSPSPDWVGRCRRTFHV